MLVLLDNGHGENTPGKRSPDSRLLEFAYTRRLAKAIHERLNENLIFSVLLVPELNDISLSERVARANAHYEEDKNCFLVSIHCNAAGDGSSWQKASGWSAYTSRGDTESDNIARYFYAAADKYLIGQKVRKFDNDRNPDFEEDFTVLKRTKCPAILIENMFQDNEKDVAYLLSESGFETLVRLHTEAIINYIKDRHA